MCMCVGEKKSRRAILQSTSFCKTANLVIPAVGPDVCGEVADRIAHSIKDKDKGEHRFTEISLSLSIISSLSVTRFQMWCIAISFSISVVLNHFLVQTSAFFCIHLRKTCKYFQSLSFAQAHTHTHTNSQMRTAMLPYRRAFTRRLMPAKHFFSTLDILRRLTLSIADGRVSICRKMWGNR